MSQIGLSSNIYHISNKYLEVFNEFLIQLNFDQRNISEQQIMEMKQLVDSLLDKDSQDYQIQMIYMVIDEHIRNQQEDTDTVLNSIRSFLVNKDKVTSSITCMFELITTALDRECDLAYSRIQSR